MNALLMWLVTRVFRLDERRETLAFLVLSRILPCRISREWFYRIATMPSADSRILLPVALELGIDKWYATDLLGWEIESSWYRNADYHFHTQTNYPVYPSDYRHRLPLFA
jgi:hypothetical protein